MKKLIILLLLISGYSYSQNCPITGDKSLKKFQINDSLKNRLEAGKVFNNSVTLDKFLTSGNDINRFKASDYVKISGYVKLVKYGGAETRNCHSSNKSYLDIHIELVKNIEDDGTKVIIVEINRYSRIKNKAFTLENIKKFVGKKVNIEGYMFFDEEHKQNAFNTNPTGTNLWRATAWEVHPVIKIY